MQIIDDGDNTPIIPGMVIPKKVVHKYELPDDIEERIRSIKHEFGYGGLSQAVYVRTYSQRNEFGIKEKFPDTIIRVVKGILSIAKDFRICNGLEWNENYWNDIAYRLGRAMMNMQFLPPGRGLWIAGTEYSYTRGSAAFNNCGFVSLNEGLIIAVCWTMDLLMCGCGIGFDVNCNEEFNSFVVPNPESERRCYIIHDSREGWVKSVYLLLDSYFSGIYTIFDYSRLRKEGDPIRGFGGESSGPDPLRILHKRIRIFIECYIKCKTYDNFESIVQMTSQHIDIFPESNIIERPSLLFALDSLLNFTDAQKEQKTYASSRLICDIFNAVGICIIAGNVRRSSEIALGSISDVEFRNLKDHDLNPERSVISWMSNNTVCLDTTEDFELLPNIANRIISNGEPGIFNRLNVKRYGRVLRREPIGREAEEDKAIGLNPCGEISLESFELCNLAEVFPTRCSSLDEMHEATFLATLYSSTVSLLPSHWINTNRVIARNRRIGISLSGIIEQIDRTSATDFTKLCRSLYKIVRRTNKHFAQECGVPESIRVTTVKPSGTISQLVGVSSGVHHNTFKYCIRRVRVSSTSSLVRILTDSGYKYEVDRKAGEGTLVFEFPLKLGNARTAEEVTVWEQACNLALLQREWADNCVSCTLYFDRETEAHNLEHVLAQFAPVVKSLSALPHTKTGVYDQAPYEFITQEQYEELNSKIIPLNTDTFCETPVGVRGCDGDKCIY